MVRRGRRIRVTTPFDDGAERAAAEALRIFRREIREERPPRPCYALALVFDWERADWYRWAPLPVLLELRKLEAAPEGHDQVRAFWDPYVPAVESWAEPREIIDGLGAPMVEVSSDLIDSRRFERAAVQMHESVADAGNATAADEDSLTAEESYAVLVARTIAASDPATWGVDITPDFVTFPYTSWDRVPHLVKASLPEDQVQRFLERGLLPRPGEAGENVPL